MSQLIIVAFDGQETANEVLSKLQSMKQDWVLSLEEVAVLKRDPEGSAHLTRSSKLTDKTSVAGGSLGVLLLLPPQLPIQSSPQAGSCLA